MENFEPNSTLAPVGESFDLREMPVSIGEQAHLMNLKDAFGSSMEKNCDIFESAFRPLHEEGQLLYHRRILSAMDTHVRVWDEVANRERTMLMFGSNNYLGFANEPMIRERVHQAVDAYGVGMAGPMILNGSGTLQQELEFRLAKFKSKESAVVMPTGYQANLAWVTALLTDRAVLLYDESSHASLIDAIRLGRKKAFRYAGQNLKSLEELLIRFREKDVERDIFISTPGVYSMSGEIADLVTITGLAEKYHARVVIDDAHGTGVLGDGRGTAEHLGVGSKIFLSMGTFSKAFSVTGGFLAGDLKVINFVRFFARPYFFTAAIAPMIAAAVLAGLDILETSTERVQKLQSNADFFRDELRAAGISFQDTDTPIIPVRPPRSRAPGEGSHENFRDWAQRLHKNDLFVNPIEAPAVPLGTERFRVSVMATHSHEDLRAAVQIMKRVFGSVR